MYEECMYDCLVIYIKKCVFGNLKRNVILDGLEGIRFYSGCL